MSICHRYQTEKKTMYLKVEKKIANLFFVFFYYFQTKFYWHFYWIWMSSEIFRRAASLSMRFINRIKHAFKWNKLWIKALKIAIEQRFLLTVTESKATSTKNNNNPDFVWHLLINPSTAHSGTSICLLQFGFFFFF